MHELPVINSILSVVLKHAEKNNVKKVMKIYLQVGELSELEDKWMQHYFEYLAKEGPAAGAVLDIERIPVEMQCLNCGSLFKPALNQSAKTVCPDCGDDKPVIVSGKAYYIKNMEVI
jgi:hydrogenase nickel incorporation protein HypA/HybF